MPVHTQSKSPTHTCLDQRRGKAVMNSFIWTGERHLMRPLV